jgi:hypothetical protein
MGIYDDLWGSQSGSRSFNMWVAIFQENTPVFGDEQQWGYTAGNEKGLCLKLG